MNKVLTASFDTEEALKAAQHDLTTSTIAGFPREKIRADKGEERDQGLDHRGDRGPGPENPSGSRP